MNEHEPAHTSDGEQPPLFETTAGTPTSASALASRPPCPPSAPRPAVLDGLREAAAGAACPTAGASTKPGLLRRIARRFGAGVPAVATNEAGDVALPKNAKLERLPRIAGQPAEVAYALVTRGLPLPPGGVAYLVESREPAGTPAVVPGGAVQVVAYIDGFGRAFSVGSVQVMPPAREPELQFMRYVDASSCSGCIEVATAPRKTARLAEYIESPAGSFCIVAPRVDLGIDASGLALHVACALAFLALWLFPRNEGVSLTTVSVKDVLSNLRTANLFEAVDAVLLDVRRSEEHPLLMPPGVVSLLAHNLRHAGLGGSSPADLAAPEQPASMLHFLEGLQFHTAAPGLMVASMPVPGIPAAGPMRGGSAADIASFMHQVLEAAGISGLQVAGSSPHGTSSTPGAPNVRLIRTSMYANTFYVVFDRRQVSTEGARKLLETEAALNRFVFSVEELDRAGCLQSATFAQAVELESWIVDAIAARMAPYLDGTVEGVERAATGSADLDVRFDFARGCEKLRLPCRLEYGFRYDAAACELVVDVECPSSALMPTLVWQPEQEAWRERTYAEREGMASRYALHLMGVVAAVAFWAGAERGSVERVTVNCWHGLGASSGVDGLVALDDGTVRGPAAHEPACIVSVSFERAAFAAAFATAEQRAAFDADPFAEARRADAVFDLDADWHLRPVRPLRNLTEPVLHPADTNLPPELDDRPLDERTSQLLHARTVRDLGIYEDGVRKSMAEEVARAFSEGGAEAAISAVRDVHDRTENPLVREVALEVEARISAGRYTADKKGPLIEAFSDIYGLQRGMKEAHRLLHTNPAEACAQLQDLIDYCDENLWFADTATRRYRYFDSYASRAVYAARHPEAADGRELRLCPDEYYLCHYRLSTIMDNSLDYAEEAIAHARRCVELAPTVAASHMRLARCYFGVFDYLSEIDAIKEAIRVVWNPSDLGMAFYWLGYAYCMVDKFDVGAACYQLCATYDQSLAEPASTELSDLARKREWQSRSYSSEECDALLRSEGIALDEVSANVEALVQAAGAAVDVQSYGLARNYLNAAQITLRDDALPPVLESLEE